MTRWSTMRLVMGTGTSTGRPAGPSWFCYEDTGYKHIPGLLAWRIAKLFRSGLWPTPAAVPVDVDQAVQAEADRRGIGWADEVTETNATPRCPDGRQSGGG